MSLIPADFEQVCNELLKYHGDHYWELVWYAGYDQMVLFWNNRPVYIF